ncbi:hypothetical protein [uncultured Spirosoma sp.]|uniref:hypothetical protein n=1 Tax=uncultured Spirosoma sp. TaxID=278208 RepID=UPI00258F6200|nr:hypothetical protein [uncultured Spirosoma sp.]
MKALVRFPVLLGLLCLCLSTLAQTPATGTMSVNDRMAKARAAKAAKRDAANATAAMPPSEAKAKKEMKLDDASAKKAAKAETKSAKEGAMAGKEAMKEEKATPADYKAPVDKSMKGPNGEAVMTGPRGGKFYINKKGNKAYLRGQKGS